MKPTQILERIKRRLPHSVQRIVSVLGWDTTLFFLKKHGGQKTEFPMEYTYRNGLFAGLTQKQAEALIAEFGGEKIRIPKHTRMLASERYQHILHDYETRGLTIEMLCEKYERPRRTIEWILKETKE